MRLALLIVGVLAGCSTEGLPIVVGRDAAGQNIYGISGHPKLDDKSGLQATSYCQSRGKATIVLDNGYKDGVPFTFRCKDAAAAAP